MEDEQNITEMSGEINFFFFCKCQVKSPSICLSVTEPNVPNAVRINCLVKFCMFAGNELGWGRRLCGNTEAGCVTPLW